MTYNVTINDDELKALQELWWFSNEECINNKTCATCRFLNPDDGSCKSNIAYNIVKKCVEWSIKFGNKGDNI